MKSYSERLRDPRWQRRRLEVMSRDQFRCRDCLATHLTLNVHHAYYLKRAMPWEYPDAAYVTLCRGCHEKAEQRRQEILEFTAEPDVQQAVWKLARWLGQRDKDLAVSPGTTGASDPEPEPEPEKGAGRKTRADESWDRVQRIFDELMKDAPLAAGERVDRGCPND